MSHPHGVIPGVDVQRRAGHVASVIREQIGRSGAAVVGFDRPVERRPLLEHRLHRREAGDRARRKRAHRPCGDRVDADALEPQIPSQIADRGVERRLGDAHHVVVRNGALTAEVRHRHDRAAPASLHQRLGGTAAGDERVRADVDRHPEAVTRRVDEPPLEILCRGECNGVDEDVEPPAEGVGYLGEDAGDVLVRADVALRDQRARDSLGQVADALLDALSLVRERNLGSLVGEAVSDGPRDGALVGDPQDERLLAVEPAGHPAILNG